MDLETYILENFTTIEKEWFKRLIETYPPDTTQFLRRQKDAMANPVGSSVRQGMEGVLKCLVDGARSIESGRMVLNREKLGPFLDRIIRIRALQNFSPSDSLYFIIELRNIFRSRLAKAKGLSEEDKTALELAMEEMLFLGFDIYTTCRERLFEIKVKDEQRKNYMLLRKANIICETEEDGTELPDLRDSGNKDQSEER